MVAYLRGPLVLGPWFLVPPPSSTSFPVEGCHPTCHPVFHTAFHPHTTSVFPVDGCLTVGSWVIFYANCKLSVKIVVIGLIQQCQPNGPIGGPWSVGVGIAKKKKTGKNEWKTKLWKCRNSRKSAELGNAEHRILKWQFPKRSSKTDKNKATKSACSFGSITNALTDIREDFSFHF